MPVVAHFKAPLAAMEPFCSMPHDPPPRTATEPSRVYVCADHPDSIAIAAGNCPIDAKARDSDRASRPPARSFLVPDASRGPGRSCRREMQRLRRHGAGAAGCIVSTRRGRCWQFLDPQSSTEAQREWFSSRACPGCLTASRSSSGRAAASSTRWSGAWRQARKSQSQELFCSTPKRD